jgi:hypothetical protein
MKTSKTFEISALIASLLLLVGSMNSFIIQIPNYLIVSKLSLLKYLALSFIGSSIVCAISLAVILTLASTKFPKLKMVAKLFLGMAAICGLVLIILEIARITTEFMSAAAYIEVSLTILFSLLIIFLFMHQIINYKVQNNHFLAITVLFFLLEFILMPMETSHIGVTALLIATRFVYMLCNTVCVYFLFKTADQGKVQEQPVHEA